MDEFFELLPFIIGILYFVFGVGKKKKDSPKRRSPRPKSEPTTSSLEDILRELTGEAQQSKPAPEPVPEYVEEPEAPVEHKSIALEYKDQYVHDADTGRSMVEIREEMMEEKGLEEGEKISFDLRQAIINDTILNRPYD